MEYEYQEHVSASGAPFRVRVLVEEQEDEPMPVPVSVTESSGLNHRIDSRGSTWNGNESGGTLGQHFYALTTEKQALDVTAGSVPLVLEAGLNAVAEGDGFKKDNAGNSWNTWFRSMDSFNPLVEDFAVSWLVESITGTIREMVGLDNNPAGNNSYTSIEFAAYQINNYLYERVYESGSSVVTDGARLYLQVGDRIGIRVESGVVTYFRESGGVITDLYTSTKKADEVLFLKGALNRGNASSGHSMVGGCVVHRSTSPETVSRQIFGNAMNEISADDVARLADLGFSVSSGSTYADLNLQQQVDSRYLAGRAFSYTHGYSINDTQDTGTLSL